MFFQLRVFFTFHISFESFPKQNAGVTGTPEHSTMGPNRNSSQNGIDKYDFSHITVSNPDAF